MELLVSSKLAHPKFHGIPGNCSCQRNWCTLSSIEFQGISGNCSCLQNWRTPSSLEFHGTAGVIEIGALLVPWNSMELLVSAKLAPSKFHGIPWNCSCHRNWCTPNWRTSSSMEFHEIQWDWWCQRNWYTPSSIEFHGIRWNCWCQQNWCTPSPMEIHGIPWNCSRHRNWRTSIYMEFHGIPLNFSCHRNWHTPSYMEFHGLARAMEIGTLQIPWNSMELLVSAKLAHPKSQGNPWNCSCHPNWLTSSSMEFHEISWNFSCHRNWRTTSSMEFHGLARVMEIGAPQVPWNSMELLVSLKLAQS